ncbi:effector-associated constant component EACC1 [Actinomycetospora sp. CA-084318]|uniref:effector-associated constant component EACC1 n=1 Tax=Actinomycetospora sp. CA-084318 TaxID=3239892 RepID=UPI003D99B04F
MDIALTIADDDRDGRALGSLYKRLEKDSYIRENAQPVRRESSVLTAIDLPTIELLLTAGFKLADLALRIATWLRESKRAKQVTISVDGWETKVSPKDVKDPDTDDPVLRALVGAPASTNTRCVLIGVHDYTSLSSLPQVKSSLDELRRTLLDSGFPGVPESHLKTIEDPTSFKEIDDALASPAAANPDVLLVYFAGHGVRFEREQLRFALRGAKEGDKASTFTWSDLAALVSRIGARRTIVLLDCCYAGTAISSGKLPQNTYVIAASDTEAKVLKREQCTAFTGELVKVLRGGIEPGRPTQLFLTPESVYHQVRIGLRSRKLPEPSRRGPESIGNWPVFYNQLQGAGSSEVPPRPAPPSPWIRRHPVRVLAVAATALVLVLLGLIVFFTPGPVTSGLDLTRYCSTLAPGGATSFVIAGQDCVRPVNLDDACVYSYQTYGLKAVFASRDPNSAQCVSTSGGNGSYGGISNMSGYCVTSSRVPGVTATSKNPDYRDQWMCQLEINLDLACNAQNNTLELSAREEDNGDLDCYRTHWF